MKNKKESVRQWNLLDFFIISLIVLTAFAAFYTWVRPVQFSGEIKREYVYAYAEVELLLPEDLQWMKNELSVGEEQKDVYETLKWKILEIREEEILPGERRVVLKLKALVYLEPSAVPRFGKYSLMPGGPMIFSNGRYQFEGRLMRYRMLNEIVAN